MALLIPPVGALAFGPGRPAALRVLCAAALCALAAGFVLAVSRGAWIALAGGVRAEAAPDAGTQPRAQDRGRRWQRSRRPRLSRRPLYSAFPLMRERVDQLVRDAGERSRPVDVARRLEDLRGASRARAAGRAATTRSSRRYRPEGNRDQPIYAHCDYLNTLSDYGAVGFVLLFGAAGGLWRGGARGARGLAGAAVTGLLAFALHLLRRLPPEDPRAGDDRRDDRGARHGRGVAGRGAGRERAPGPLARPVAAPRGRGRRRVHGLLGRFPSTGPTRPGGSAREKIDRLARAGADVSGERDVLAGVRAAPRQGGRARSRERPGVVRQGLCGFALGAGGPARTVVLGVEAARDAGRALDLCPVVAEFWIRRGVGLDMQGRWMDGGRRASSRALQIAPARADGWYYQAYHLSLSPGGNRACLGGGRLLLAS